MDASWVGEVLRTIFEALCLLTLTTSRISRIILYGALSPILYEIGVPNSALVDLGISCNILGHCDLDS